MLFDQFGDRIDDAKSLNADPASLPKPKKPVVLVVDDVLQFLRNTAAILRNDCDLMLAKDARQAIIMITRTRRLDMLILDDGLPDMDGVELLRRIRKLPSLAQKPVIFLSSHDPDKLKERAVGLNAEIFLQKPVKADVLLSAVRNILHLSDPNAQTAGGQT
jgi:CheY-like chemotaxis protein